MANFCGKCGAKLDETTGLCPRCDADKLNKHIQTPTPKQDTISESAKPLSKKEAKKKRKTDKKVAKKERKKEKRAKLTMEKIRRFFLKFFAIVLALLVVSGCAAGALVYFEIAEIPVLNDVVNWVVSRDVPKSLKDEMEEYMVKPIDADNYFGENSSIISSVEVNSSNKAKTEADAYNLLTSLGFSMYEITTEYSMNGTYYSAVGIDETSDEKHPMYQTYYISAKGEVWTVILIGDVIMAYPVSYNIQAEKGVSVMFSETESIMSYDSATNKFFETIPNESALIIKVVETINSETLENLTIEVIDSYE